MKDQINLSNYRADSTNVGDWGGNEELAARQLNRITGAIFESASTYIDGDFLAGALHGVWDDWGSDERLLELTDDEIGEYVSSSLRHALSPEEKLDFLSSGAPKSVCFNAKELLNRLLSGEMISDLVVIENERYSTETIVLDADTAYSEDSWPDDWETPEPGDFTDAEEWVNLMHKEFCDE